MALQFSLHLTLLGSQNPEVFAGCSIASPNPEDAVLRNFPSLLNTYFTSLPVCITLNLDLIWRRQSADCSKVLLISQALRMLLRSLFQQ